MITRLLIFISVLFSSLCLAQNSSGWLIQNISSHLYAVHFTSESNGWAVGENGIILNTSDGGATWNVRNTIQTDSMMKFNERCISVHFIDDVNG
jgi:photosystem II stability/assembly factor-like uncharacterized protein